MSDLVHLRYRGDYIAIKLLTYSIGATIDAFVRGTIVDHISWRWAFCINLLVGAVSLLIMSLFLNVNHHNNLSRIDRVKRIDFVGNRILIGGTASMLIALIYASTRYSLSSWRTLLPLLLDFATFLALGAFEASRFVPTGPVIPQRLFSNRTSIIVDINTFLFDVVIYWESSFYLSTFNPSNLLPQQEPAIPVALLGVPAAAAAG